MITAIGRAQKQILKNPGERYNQRLMLINYLMNTINTLIQKA